MQSTDRRIIDGYKHKVKEACEKTKGAIKTLQEIYRKAKGNTTHLTAITEHIEQTAPQLNYIWKNLMHKDGKQ